MESRRWIADGTARNIDVGMAFQTLEAHFLARQHAWIRGTMGLMTGSTAFHPHRRVLESKWPALVPVAAETTRFVGGHRTQGAVDLASMGVMAIDAANAAFLQPVAKGFLELGDGSHVACATFFKGFSPGHVVDGVAPGAGHLIAGMAAKDIADACSLIAMALQTGGIGLPNGQFQRVFDVGRCGRLCVNAPRAVARLAGFLFPTMFSVGFDDSVRSLEKGVKELFVAALTDYRSHILRLYFLVFVRSGGSLLLRGKQKRNY